MISALLEVLQGDHPRVCGENVSFIVPYQSAEGSPPRVRGKHHRRAPSAHLRGITPACAGKTTRSGRSSSSTGDHPRVCGENLDIVYKGVTFQGSPPRVRGKLLHGKHLKLVSGITPACAGKTQPRICR